MRQWKREGINSRWKWKMEMSDGFKLITGVGNEKFKFFHARWRKYIKLSEIAPSSEPHRYSASSVPCINKQKPKKIQFRRFHCKNIFMFSQFNRKKSVFTFHFAEQYSTWLFASSHSRCHKNLYLKSEIASK